METRYNVTLEVAHVSAAHRAEAVAKYRTALERELGGAAAVVALFRKYSALMEKYQDTPPPASASDDERAAMLRWEAADTVASRAAFEGWYPPPEGLWFGVDTP